MAVRGDQEHELLKGGTKAVSSSDSQYVQNMLWKNNAWEVRKGFGQVVQLDTTFTAVRDNTSAAQGYERHHGSHLIYTVFGHQQLVSVFSGKVVTGSSVATTTNIQRSQRTTMYMVSIYDLTTGARWEEGLSVSTAEKANTQDNTQVAMPEWHGVYETNQDADHQHWVQAPKNVGKSLPRGKGYDTKTAGTDFWFVEERNVLYFGNKDTGVYAYIPATFRTHNPLSATNLSNRQQSRAIETIAKKSWAPPYSESCLIRKVVASTGAVNEGLGYFTTSIFPKPNAATVLPTSAGPRLVYADDYTVYFADGYFPSAIMRSNFLLFPGDEPITALAAQGEALIIWTESTMWYYMPNEATVCTAGRLVQASATVGCAGPNAVFYGEGYGGMYWLDARGCYQMTGKLSYQKISGAIDSFFTSEMANPLHHYFTDTGQLQDNESSSMPGQPRMSLRVRTSGVSTAFYPRENMAIFCVPEMDVALCFNVEVKQWSIWSTQSIATKRTGVAVVEGDSTTTSSLASGESPIKNPWLLATAERLFLVGTEESETLASRTLLGGTGSAETAYNRANPSYYILEYGRGGSIDRSVEKGEDRRLVTGKWKVYANPSGTTHDSSFLIGRPIPIPQGSTVGNTSSTAEGAVWLPVSLVKGEADTASATGLTDVERISFIFEFDSSNWTPLFRVASTGGTETVTSCEIAWRAPAERVASQEGWGYAAPHAERGIYVYDGAGTAFSRTANEIYMMYDPGNSTSAASGTWLHKPSLNISDFKEQVLVYLPFTPAAGSTADYTVGFGIKTSGTRKEAKLWDSRATSDFGYPNILVWVEARLGGKAHADNDVAQPIDWVYKSDNISLKDDVQVKARTVYPRVLSHGAAADAYRVSPNWTYGLLNTVISADMRGWCSQVIDVAPTADGQPGAVQQVTSVGTIRSRTKNISYSESSTYDDTETGLVNAVFGTATDNTSPKYGTLDSTGDTGVTKYLIGDEQVDTLAISDSVKGESLTFMFFGHLRNKAEKLVVESLRAVLRVAGGRRRRGR